MIQRTVMFLLVLLISTGCNLLYKQNVQQGNAMDQDDLDQLELGMTRNQVTFLLGTPAVQDPFHADRWDYVQTFSRRGGKPIERKITLLFENDRVISMEGVEDPYAVDLSEDEAVEDSDEETADGDTEENDGET
jgi:outer membrane protein assembly factor BamE